MKPNTLILLITVATVSARPLVPPNSDVDSLPLAPRNDNGSPGVVGKLLASATTPSDTDIDNEYMDGTEELNTYGACVTIDNKNDKVLESSVFSTLVRCDLYQDTKCTELIESPARTLPLPPVVALPNVINIGGKFAQAYKCSPLLATTPTTKDDDDT